MIRFVRARPWLALGAAALAGALVVGLIWGVSAAVSASLSGSVSDAAGADPRGDDDTGVGADPDGTGADDPESSDDPSDGGSAAPGTPPSAGKVDCPADGTHVGTAKELQAAMDAATPGEVILIDPGTYAGNFVAATSGSADKPITLCGSADAVLDGGGPKEGYVVHLDGASYWKLIGFTVTNGQKGVMADGTVGSLIQGLTVNVIGDEAVHLRRTSTDNRVVGNTISDTGNRKPKFGEGIYIGTAESNWCDISGCEPDPSDRNIIEGNVIFDTSSESIDIKEGTSDGIVRGNTFDGSGLDGDADSWVDVKGSDWLIEDNTGVNSSQDGFQTHEIVDGWGTRNVFRGNTATVNGPGFGYSLTPERDNVVECDNTASAAGEGLTNVTCKKG